MRCIVALCLFLCAVGPVASATAKDVWVGAEYFAGWWENPQPNKWQNIIRKQYVDWRDQYPERVPLLGAYNTQETMDGEIDAAAAYGVDYFSILWYYPHNFKERNTHHTDKAQLLNAGVNQFMQSKNAHKMRFMVSICNSPIFPLNSKEDWLRAMDEVLIPAMKHPSYLKVDTRPVIKIHSGVRLFRVAGKNNLRQTVDILQAMRQKAHDAGIGDILIMIGHYGKVPVHEKSPLRGFLSMNIDGIMQYMDDMNPSSVKRLPNNEEYPYEDLVKRAADIRNVRQHDKLPYVPYVPTGWNSKPWEVSKASRALFALPTAQEWGEALKALKAEMASASNFGFPRKDGTIQKSFTIYAWNEFGEGGILAPTKKNAYTMLEEVKKYFPGSAVE